MRQFALILGEQELANGPRGIETAAHSTTNRSSVCARMNWHKHAGGQARHGIGAESRLDPVI